MTPVVFLIRNVAACDFGGGEIYQLRLANELRRNGFRPIIISNSVELLDRASSEGFDTLTPPYSRCQNWSGWRNILLPKYYFFQKKLKRWYKNMIEEYHPKVLNIQSRDDWIAATKVGKQYNLKIIWTDHADFRNWVLWNVNRKFKNMIGKEIIKQSRDTDKVIFVSNALRRETEKMIAPKKLEHVVVIENGVEDRKEDYGGEKVKPDSFVFLGRVVVEKGINELLEAFSMLQADISGVSLDIYGDGVIDKMRCANFKNVKFHGPTKEPLAGLARGEVFVLPSHREGMSLSLLEAEMMGKKIIASDIRENREVIKNGKNGILVAVGDRVSLYNAMKTMLTDEKRSNEMAIAARKDFEEKRDFRKIFKEKMICLY